MAIALWIQSYLDNVIMKFMVNNRREEKKLLNAKQAKFTVVPTYSGWEFRKKLIIVLDMM